MWRILNLLSSFIILFSIFMTFFSIFITVFISLFSPAIVDLIAFSAVFIAPVLQRIAALPERSSQRLPPPVGGVNTHQDDDIADDIEEDIDDEEPSATAVVTSVSESETAVRRRKQCFIKNAERNRGRQKPTNSDSEEELPDFLVLVQLCHTLPALNVL